MAPLVLDYFSQKAQSLFFPTVPVPTKSDKQLARGDFSKKLLSIRIFLYSFFFFFFFFF